MPGETALWRDMASIAKDWARWSPAEKLAAAAAGLATVSVIVFRSAL
ncbi:hypothetical protein JL100_035040 (plasmid) [Skermanella mucosa]|nr:hypothetical protein [Skermanella mucosa]UEM25279.1 hypothetical protein JL100_035040 [Skermanella mucosa]